MAPGIKMNVIHKDVITALIWNLHLKDSKNKIKWLPQQLNIFLLQDVWIETNCSNELRHLNKDRAWQPNRNMVNFTVFLYWYKTKQNINLSCIKSVYCFCSLGMLISWELFLFKKLNLTLTLPILNSFVTSIIETLTETKTMFCKPCPRGGSDALR